MLTVVQFKMTHVVVPFSSPTVYEKRKKGVVFNDSVNCKDHIASVMDE